MGLFNINGGFWRFMNRAMDVLVLNILWLAFSLPVFTVGAATCAAFSVTLKMVDEEEGYVARMFVKAFRANFRQGTFMWLITAPCVYAAFLIWQVVAKADGIGFIAILGAIFFTAIVIATNLYAYPLIARYDNTLKNMIKNSFGICVQYFGRTIFLVVLVALEIAIIFWNRVTLAVGAFIGPEFIIYTISAIAKRIFQQLDKNTSPPDSTETPGTINQ